MAGDHTRFTFDPVKSFSGVYNQQGRVSLDSDQIEYVEIQDRLGRARMLDTVGRAVVPRTSENGFEIGLAVGKLTIGAGRVYVDGILVECFGDAATRALDASLGAARGTGPLLYDDQPFHYGPGFPAPSPAPGAIDLVYLDVWQREVTVFERPELREPALGGPDTTTRVQTAWQVKVLHGADASSCKADPTGWADLTAPTSVRLSAAAPKAPPPTPGPCVIEPQGGYDAGENRLYRVEVHKGGKLGDPTKPQFKWSRDNASIAMSVKNIAKGTPSGSVVTVDSTGRDDRKRLARGDHLELIDDSSEFALRDTNAGRALAKVVKDVNPNSAEIVVDQDWSGLTLKNPRLRRWDRLDDSEPLTRDVEAGKATPLENGISITFDVALGDRVRAGDHWVFSTRAAKGDVDPPLVAALPHGVLHHFAKLALFTVGGSKPLSCRTLWPPEVHAGEGCCTAVVAPGEDIQAAIDSLDGTGGCVCLKMGLHRIDAPLQIRQQNLTIHGEVPWVTVRLAEAGPAMLEIAPAGDGLNVSVEGIRFEAPSGFADAPMIRIVGVTRGRIANCHLQIADGNADPATVATGIELEGCADYVVEDSTLTGFANGIVGAECSQVRVLDNTLEGIATNVADALSLGAMGIAFSARDQPIAGIEIDRNVLRDFRRGIRLGDVTVSGTVVKTEPAIETSAQRGCRVVANVVDRRGQLGSPAAGPGVGAVAFAIAAHVGRCEIVENAITIAGFGDSGILAAGVRAFVARNAVRSEADFDPDQELPRLPFGVVAYVARDELLGCTVCDNRFTGLQQAVLAVGRRSDGPGAHRIDVLDNRIDGSAELRDAILQGGVEPGGLAGTQAVLARYGSIVVGPVQHSRIAGNEIASTVCGISGSDVDGLSIATNRVSDTILGIALTQAQSSDVSDNIVQRARVAGVALLLGTDSVAAGNRVTESDVGIAAESGQRTCVAGNSVQRGTSGIELFLESDAVVRGNTVEEAQTDGITAITPVGDLTLVDNRADRCGYRDTAAPNPAPATGIAALGRGGAVFIDGCHAVDVGESAFNISGPFRGVRLGVAVLGAARARVHGCVVSSRPLVPPNPGDLAIAHPASRAIVVATSGDDAEGPPFADATDNVAEQAAELLVEVAAQEGEVMFAANRCTNLAGVREDKPTVTLAGEHVIVNGNRVRAVGDGPSLGLAPTASLSAVANVTDNGASISPSPGLEQPTPYDSFNVKT